MPRPRRARRQERFAGLDVRDTIERLARTAAAGLVGLTVAWLASTGLLVDVDQAGVEVAIGLVATVLANLGLLVWAKVSTILPDPGDGLTRSLPTARAQLAGWRQRGDDPVYDVVQLEQVLARARRDGASRVTLPPR